ncbi:unnamed protein product [Closterium sp. NIES-53]
MSEHYSFYIFEDLVSHLRASDARYRAVVPAEFLDKNQPPMFITLYFIVTRLPDSLRSVRDHFLSLDPTSLTVDLLEQHLLAAETSAVAVGAARGTPRLPFFEGCYPSPLGPSYASAAAADVSVAEDVGAASAAAARARVARVVEVVAAVVEVVAGVVVGAAVEVVAAARLVEGVGALVVAVEASVGVAAVVVVGLVAVGLELGVFVLGVVSVSSSSVRARPTRPSSFVSGFCVGRLGVVARMSFARFGDNIELPRSAASACFFRDSNTLTPLSIPVPIRLADPSGGLLVARSSTVLPCPAVPSSSLSGLHLPLISTILVSTAALQGAMVTTTTLGGQRVTICTCTRAGRHLATFTHRPGSSLYTLANEPPHVAASAHVSVSGQVAASCSCRLLSHQTLQWHHRLGHPSLPRLRGMHSRLLVSGLPRSLPPLPPSPAPPCLLCVEGRQRAAPHSSSFPPSTAPLQTLNMDAWGPARISGQSCERYNLLVVDDYTRYTTVFPLRSKGQVVDVLIPWIRTVHLQLRERFGQDLHVLRLHSVRGGEFSSNLLWDFCHGEGILRSFTLPDSPQQNGIAERRIGLVMEVARTSMIHAVAPHFLWPFAVRYAAHQLNLWPRVFLPKTSPTLRWSGEVGDVSVFRFYHPTSRRVFPSQDVTFYESVPFYCLFSYRSAPPPPSLLFLAPGPAPVDPLPPQGPTPSGVSQVDPLRGPTPVQVAVGSGAARSAASEGAEPGGSESEGAETGGAEPGGVETGGAEPEGVEPRGAASEGAESGGAEPQRAALSGGSAGALSRLSPHQQREWFVQCARLRSGATGAGGAGAAGAGGAKVADGAGVTGGTTTTGPGGARTRGTGTAGLGVVEGAEAGDPTESGATGAGSSSAGGAGAGGAGVGGTGAGGAGVGGPGAGGARAGGAGAIDLGGAAVAVVLSPGPPIVGGGVSRSALWMPD